MDSGCRWVLLAFRVTLQIYWSHWPWATLQIWCIVMLQQERSIQNKRCIVAKRLDAPSWSHDWLGWCEDSDQSKKIDRSSGPKCCFKNCSIKNGSIQGAATIAMRPSWWLDQWNRVCGKRCRLPTSQMQCQFTMTEVEVCAVLKANFNVVVVDLLIVLPRTYKCKFWCLFWQFRCRNFRK